MMPLEVGGMFVDRHKSSILLSYLAKASLREKKREIRKEKLQVGLKRLKHLDTDRLSKHLTGLESHLEKAEEKQDLIEDRQEQEDAMHKEFHRRLEKMHGKLSGFIDRQQKLKRKVTRYEREHSAKHKKAEALRQGLRTLKLVFNKAKLSKNYSKAELEKVQKRIADIEKELKKF